MTIAILDARDKEYVVVAAGTDLIATYVQQAILAGQTAQEVLDAILAAGLSEGVFPSEAAGESGTTSGQYFWVGSGGTVALYRNDAGVGTEIAELATMAALTSQVAAVQADADAAQADATTANLGVDRIDNIAPAPGYALWEPAAELSADSYFDTAPGGGDADDLYALWEALRAAYPSRVTRDQIGTDESATYPLWAYTIAPIRENRRKILVNCGAHGGELHGMLGTLRAMAQFLGDDARKDERVRWLNDYCTVVVVPVLNPWGLSQNPRDRNNVNFVDLNRNWDFEWAAFVNPVEPGFGTKGTAAFSEAETAALLALIEANPDFYRSADMHGFTVNSSANIGLIYPPVWYLDSPRKHWASMLSAYGGSDGSVSTEDAGPQPNSSNSIGTRGLECVTAEYIPLPSPVFVYSADDMTRSVRFHGNVILELANGDAPQYLKKSQPFCREYYYTLRPSPLPTDETGGAALYLVDDFIPACSGFLLFQGDVTFQGPVGTAVRFFVKPNIGQDGAHPEAFRQSQGTYNFQRIADLPAITSVGAYATLPFHVAMPVREGLPLRVGLKAWASVGTGSRLFTGVGTLTFIPSDTGGDIFKLFQPHTVTNVWTERAPHVLAIL